MGLILGQDRPQMPLAEDEHPVGDLLRPQRRIRLLEDRELEEVAWKVADQLGWPDTFDAEYVALTQLQADALITLDRQLAHAVKDLVTVAPIEALF